MEVKARPTKMALERLMRAYLIRPILEVPHIFLSNLEHICGGEVREVKKAGTGAGNRRTLGKV